MSYRSLLQGLLLPALACLLVLTGVSTAPAQAATGNGNATIGTASHPVDGTNIARGAGELVIYTSPVSVTPTNQWGSEVTVVGGKVTAVNNRQASQSLTGTRVPADGYVLSGHGDAMDWLVANAHVGATVTLSGTTTPAPPPPQTGTTVTVGAATATLAGTNIPRAADALVLYTPAAGTTTPTNVYGAEAVVIANTVTALRDRQATNASATAIPTNGYVLSGHGTARDWLLANAHVGATVTLSGTTTPAPPTTADRHHRHRRSRNRHPRRHQHPRAADAIFRTAPNRAFYAAVLLFRYSLWTSCGVR